MKSNVLVFVVCLLEWGVARSSGQNLSALTGARLQRMPTYTSIFNTPQPSPSTTSATDTRPNIIVILADDMGYSDLGCTGGEIATPNLDRLAGEGLLFTHCYNTSRCCPSRASLLTGLYQHRAGVGFMSSDLGNPSYQGHLNQQCVTIAEVLKEKGYRTIMSGKWHVGDEREYWPDKRGFERFYGIPKGGGLYFYPSKFIDRPIYRNAKRVKPDSATFYSTDAFTKEAMNFMEEASKDEKPFFLYLAYIAPHYPLQAWPEDIAKYKGRYDQGYEAIRQQRYSKQQKLHIVGADAALSPSDFPSWKTVEDQAEETRKMEVYAAQVDRMDQNIGKLLDRLEKMGELGNTVIMFLSDNGACAEEENRSPDAPIGTAASFVAYGQHWANVSNTPYRLYKSMTHEGGIITPLIVHWPEGIATSGQLVKEMVHINDIMPTCLELAGAAYPDQYQGRKILSVDGRSFTSLLRKEEEAVHNQLFWEHKGNQAIRKGDWKLVRRHRQPWELYNLERDPTELHNLSKENKTLLDTLKDTWKHWAEEAGVQEWPIK